MKNVLDFTSKFFSDANISENLLNLQPMTSAGKVFKVNMLQHIKESKMDLAFVAKLLTESGKVQNDSSVDAFIQTIKENYQANKNAVKIGFLFEQLNGASLPIVQETADAIDAVISEGEDAITVSIMSGPLAKHKARYADLMVIESEAINTRIANEQTVVTEKFEISNPVSYVEKVGETAFVRIHNSVFAINENSMAYGNAPSKKFVQMSDIAKNVVFEGENVIAKNAVGTFVISESGISKMPEGETMINESAVQDNLIENINETLNEVAHKFRMGHISEEQTQEFDNVIAVSENYESFYVLENVTLVKNRNTGDVGFVAKQGQNFYGCILESNRNLRKFETYSNVAEAVNFIKEKTGIDVSENFKSDFEDAARIDEEKSMAIDSVNKKINDYIKRLDVVKENMNVLEEGSPAYEKYASMETSLSEAIVVLERQKKDILEGNYEEEETSEAEELSQKEAESGKEDIDADNDGSDSDNDDDNDK